MEKFKSILISIANSVSEISLEIVQRLENKNIEESSKESEINAIDILPSLKEGDSYSLIRRF